MDSETTGDLLRLLTSEVVDVRRPRIAVLGGDTAEPLAEELRSRFAATVVALESDSSESAAHVALCAHNPYRVIVDVSGSDGPTQVTWFRRSFMHLRPGGAYVVLDPVGPDPAPGSTSTPGDPWQDLSTMLELAPREPADPTEPESVKDHAWIGLAVAAVERCGRIMWIRSHLRYLAKLRDEDLEVLLQIRRPRIGVTLARRPAGVMVPKGSYGDSSELLGENHFADPYDFTKFHLPPLYLRRYTQPVCGRSQIVVNRGLLLPDTFRHHQARRLMNNYLWDNAKLFARPRISMMDPEPIDGAYFYFDSEWPGHFGHTLTEQLSRMWAFDRARSHDPDIKLLTTLGRRAPRLERWELDLLSAFGLGANDVHISGTRAVRPERLYAASPMFSLPEYVVRPDDPRYQPGYACPELVATWDRVVDALLRRTNIEAAPERIFCSRRVTLKRACRNVGEVEDFFRQHGFEVIYPEEHSLPDQVALFDRASVIAGLAGSGLFTSAFCRAPKTVIMISSWAYSARNEYLIAALRGHHLRVAWSRPELEHPENRWSSTAFSSPFSVDLDREGRYLRQVIDDLPG